MLPDGIKFAVDIAAATMFEGDIMFEFAIT